jgi:hypothetical protein
LAQDPELQKADSILDKLERSLLDQSPDSLSFGEKVKAKTPPTTKSSVPVYTYESTSPIESDAGSIDFKSLTRLISDLENQVDKLASSVQATKQKIVDDASIDNFITLEAGLTNSDHAAIKNISVRLDGYNVYAIDDASGLWMPSKHIPLYAGPLQPGTHRIDVEARVVMKHKKSLPLHNDVYRLVNKTFEVSVPGGSVNRTWRIEFEPPKSVEQGVTATLKQL